MISGGTWQKSKFSKILLFTRGAEFVSWPLSPPPHFTTHPNPPKYKQQKQQHRIKTPSHGPTWPLSLFPFAVFYISVSLKPKSKNGALFHSYFSHQLHVLIHYTYIFHNFMMLHNSSIFGSFNLFNSHHLMKHRLSLSPSLILS
jgi:hypothetical protein